MRFDSKWSMTPCFAASGSSSLCSVKATLTSAVEPSADTTRMPSASFISSAPRCSSVRLEASSAAPSSSFFCWAASSAAPASSWACCASREAVGIPGGLQLLARGVELSLRRRLRLARIELGLPGVELPLGGIQLR
ncbi:hypothetical protein O159_27050 [Leifsonia xyli subsp. cynodontis DSM 46306]|jgi:hypothetical protein|uniref:Uncharacterized protein n=1 Tax=Leifsonia xyli subsp. cynodontis DSM 46306 TaxID=1389489 RepID=U3PG08_LEIXC|nr:hypothetical protein O159_27050 [Leifsonia xyli subsp. cynodontis DSM 46306]